MLMGVKQITNAQGQGAIAMEDVYAQAEIDKIRSFFPPLDRFSRRHVTKPQLQFDILPQRRFGIDPGKPCIGLAFVLAP